MQCVRRLFIVPAVFLSRLALFTTVASPAGALAPKAPEIEVVEMNIHRGENVVEVDTRLRNIGPKPLQGVTALYHFFAPRHSPVTTKKITLDESTLEPGAESTIHAQLEEPARAVSVEFSATGGAGHELRVKNTGPFPIE